MGGGWEVVQHPEYRIAAEPVRTQAGWEVVAQEQPAAAGRRHRLPGQHLVELLLGTVIHVCLGALLALAVLNLLVQLAG